MPDAAPARRGRFGLQPKLVTVQHSKQAMVLNIDTNTDSIKLFYLQDEVVASVQSTVQSVEVGMKFLCCSCTIPCEWVRAQRAEDHYDK